MLDFFDRCAFLALLHPPLAGTPTALQFAVENPFGGAMLVTPQTPCSPPISDGARGRPVRVGALDDPLSKAPIHIGGMAGVRGWCRGSPPRTAVGVPG